MVTHVVRFARSAGLIALFVLAAGLGTRMKSELPKVLIPVLGRPMIEYVLDALAAAGIARTIVVRTPDALSHLSMSKGALLLVPEFDGGDVAMRAVRSISTLTKP